MRFTTPAIVVSLRPHGEHGGIVRLMTPEHGLQAAYVRGARGRRMRPVLMAGNQVEASLAARTDVQLAQGTVELVHSRGPLLGEPLPAAAIDWACALTASALPEAWQSYPTVDTARSSAREMLDDERVLQVAIVEDRPKTLRAQLNAVEAKSTAPR